MAQIALTPILAIATPKAKATGRYVNTITKASRAPSKKVLCAGVLGFETICELDIKTFGNTAQKSQNTYRLRIMWE